ncbi:MAG TPA: sulfotransferase [Myxococcota bacterium]|nr:sulfotransferase [Myxococcota bacterium]
MFRRVRDAFVPRHFADPFGLALRLLRSRSPEALYAMGSAALRPLLIPVDVLLSSAERRTLARARAPTRPILFVMGPPRSGTTLVALSLIRALRVGYLNNLTALFPRSPITANRLLGRPIHPERVTLKNYYGRTARLCGPNDALYLWDRWLGADRTRPPAEISREAADALVRFFGAWEALVDAPLVAKNNSLNGSAALVGALLPTARFVCLRREPLRLAASLLDARRHILGDASDSYGIDDPSRPRLADPIQDVVRQLRFHVALADQQRAALGERFVDLAYEEFCRDPVEHIVQLGARELGMKVEPDDVRRRIPPLQVSRREALPASELAQLERALAEAPGCLP